MSPSLGGWFIAKDGATSPTMGKPPLDELVDAVASGAELVAVHKIPFFKHFARTSLHRLVRSGKIPVIRVGRIYYSTPKIAARALVEYSNITPPKMAHADACRSLDGKGIVRKTKK